MARRSIYEIYFFGFNSKTKAEQEGTEGVPEHIPCNARHSLLHSCHLSRYVFCSILFCYCTVTVLLIKNVLHHLKSARVLFDKCSEVGYASISIYSLPSSIYNQERVLYVPPRETGCMCGLRVYDSCAHRLSRRATSFFDAARLPSVSSLQAQYSPSLISAYDA